MTVLFDRTAPLFFVAPDPVEGNFDGIVVDAPERVCGFLTELNDLVTATQLRFIEVGAPEDFNQQLADEFIESFSGIMERYNGTA
jgi:hypothetical protein